MYILNNWSIKDRESRSGSIRVTLVGKVFGHPRFAPGEVITTSSVLRYRFETDSVVTHSGSEYRLGKADVTDPLAKQRLIVLLAPGKGHAGEKHVDGHHAAPLDHEHTGMHM